MPAVPAIQLTDLSCAFGSRAIVSHLSCAIEEGGFYALMGPNGSGKTTLLRAVAGLIEPASGSVSIDGAPIRDYAARALAQKLSFVRQQAQTDFEFSAFETVLMGRNPYQHRLQNESEADWHIVEEAMKQTHTWHLRFAKPHQMSGGELQRVMLARALAQHTPIMLLDEPTSNLDIAHQFEIMELLRDFNLRQHKTILIVVHDLNLALRYCPSLLLLHEGVLLYQGPTAQGLSTENIQKVFGVQAEVDNSNIRFIR